MYLIKFHGNLQLDLLSLESQQCETASRGCQFIFSNLTLRHVMVSETFMNRRARSTEHPELSYQMITEPWGLLRKH